MDLLRFLKSFYFPNRINLRPRTKREMQVVVSRFSAWLDRPAVTYDLTADNIARYLLHLIESGHSPKTAKSKRGTLLTLWRAAKKANLHTLDPKDFEIPVPLDVKRKPRAWSLKDLQAMLKQASVTYPRTERWFGPKHWTALILLIFHTGLRIQAALHLKRNDLKGHLVFVPADFQKDREEIIIPLPNYLVSMLVSLARPCIQKDGRNVNEYLIPWPWSFLHPTNQFKTYILKPAGLPYDDPKLKFHAIRRTTASIIAAKHGKEAARDALGHSSIKVTEGYLVDPELIDPDLVAAPNPIRCLPRLIG